MANNAQLDATSNASVNALVGKAYTRLVVQMLFDNHNEKQSEKGGTIISQQVIAQRASRIIENIDFSQVLQNANIDDNKLYTSQYWWQNIRPALNDAINGQLNQKISFEDLESNIDYNKYSRALPYYMTRNWYNRMNVVLDQAYLTSEQRIEDWFARPSRQNPTKSHLEDLNQNLLDQTHFDFNALMTQHFNSFANVREIPLPKTQSFAELIGVESQEASQEQANTAQTTLTVANEVPGVNVVENNADLLNMDMYFQAKELKVSEELVLTADNYPTGLRRKLYDYGKNGDNLLDLEWDGRYEEFKYIPGFSDFLDPFLDGANDRKAAKRAFDELMRSNKQLTVKQLDDAINIMSYVNSLGYAITISDTSGEMKNDSNHWKLDINFQAGNARAQIPIIHTNPERMAVYEDYEHKLELDKSWQNNKNIRVDQNMLPLDAVSRTKLLIAFCTGASEVNVDGVIYHPSIYSTGAQQNDMTVFRFVRDDGKYVPIAVNDKDGIKDQMLLRDAEQAKNILLQYIDEGRSNYELVFNRAKMDQFVLDWLSDGGEEKLNPTKNELLDAYLSDMPSVREDELKYIRLSAALHKVSLMYGMNKDTFMNVAEDDVNYVNFKNEVNQTVAQYLSLYPDLEEKFQFDPIYFTKGMDVEPFLDELYNDTLDQRIGNYEDGFNAVFIDNVIGRERSEFKQDVTNSKNATKGFILREALRMTKYPYEKLLGDNFGNELLIDDVITFDDTTAKTMDQLAEDDYRRDIMKLIDTELTKNAVSVNGSPRFLPKDSQSDNPYNIRIDDNGIVRWEGKRMSIKNSQEVIVDVYGEIGQMFERDKNGIVHTNFKGKENYAFAPGYRAYFVMDQSAINPVDNLRLHSFDKQMRDTVRALVREQMSSQFTRVNDENGQRVRLSLANKQSALNRMLYSNKTIGVYGEKLEPHSLDYDAQYKSNVASMTNEMLDAKAKTATQRIHFSKNYVTESNSRVYDNYQKALTKAMKPIYKEKDERSRYVIQDKDFIEKLIESGYLSIDHAEFLNTVLANDRRMIIESIVDLDRRNELVAKIQAHDSAGLFTDAHIQQLFKAGRSELLDFNEANDEAIQEAIRNNTTSALRLNGYQSSRIIAQSSTVGLLDPYATGQGENQGTLQFLANGVSVDPDTGKLMKLTDEERTAIMDLSMFSNTKYDPFIRQVLSTSAFMHALGVDTDTNVMYAPFYGHNFNDAMVVSKNFAQRNMVPDENGEYRMLTEGDKISDTHGNKGVISLVIDPDWTEEQAIEKNLYKEWKWFNANPTLDVVASSFAPVSRKNAGIFHEGLENGASSIEVPFENDGSLATDKQLDKGMFKMSMMILKQTADAQTKLYENPGEGRKFSGQGTWVAQAIGADELVKTVFMSQAQNKDVTSLREYLLVLGIDLDQDMNLRKGYVPHKGEHRKVFELDAFTDKNDLMNELRSSGGLLKLPFKVKGFDTGMDAEQYTSTIAILPPHLRKEVTFNEDGTSNMHEFTKMYGAIIDDVIGYYDTLNNAIYHGLTEANITSIEDEQKRKALQAKYDDKLSKLESKKASIEKNLSKLQNEIYNKVFDPDNNGKHGFVRDVVSRKAADRSATAVMTPDPRLDVNQVRIGEQMAKRLNVKEGDKIIVWRDPLIKTGGMRMVNVTIGENTGVAVNPTAPGPMGGDFDGDNLALMAVPTISKNKEEQNAFVERMYRKFSYETNLIDYGVGMKDGKYSLYLESKGMDIATAEKVFEENPEKFSKALEAKAVIDELLSDTLQVPIGEDRVMTVENDRRKLLQLFETNDAFYEGFKNKYMTAVNTFYHEAFANGYHTDHTYQAIDYDAFKTTTENIVNDKCKGKPEDIDQLMETHFNADKNMEEYKAFQREGQLATAIKTDSTGKAGAVAQKLVVLARSRDAFTNKLYSSLESSERFTQAVVSLKNNGPIAEKVSNALDEFSLLLSHPTRDTYKKLMGNELPAETYASSLKVKSQKEAMGHKMQNKMNAFDEFVLDNHLDLLSVEKNDKRLTVGQLRECMNVLYTEKLGVSLAKEDLDQVCLLLTDQNKTESMAQDVSKLLDLAHGVGFDKEKYIDENHLATLSSDKEKEIYRQQQMQKAIEENEHVMVQAQKMFDKLPVSGLYTQMQASENLFDRIQYAPNKTEIFKAAYDTRSHKLNGSSKLLQEILPNSMENMYAKSNQMPEVTDDMRKSVRDLQVIGAENAILMKDKMLEKLANGPYTKSELCEDMVESLYAYQDSVGQYFKDVKDRNPLLYQQLSSIPSVAQFKDMGNFDSKIKPRGKKEFNGEEKPVYINAFIRTNDRGLHEFAEHLIENGDATKDYMYAYKTNDRGKATLVMDYYHCDFNDNVYRIAKLDDTHADQLVDSVKVAELFDDWVSDGSTENQELFKNSNGATTLRYMFGQFEDGYDGELFESQFDVLREKKQDMQKIEVQDVAVQVADNDLDDSFEHTESTVVDDDLEL